MNRSLHHLLKKAGKLVVALELCMDWLVRYIVGSEDLCVDNLTFSENLVGSNRATCTYISKTVGGTQTRRQK